MSFTLSSFVPKNNNLDVPISATKKPTSIDVNGFDIYRMQRSNIIRVHDVSILCRHNISSGDVILKVNNDPIQNRTYKSSREYLCSNVITSIETQSYEDYNFNVHCKVQSSFMTPISVSNTYDGTSTNDTNQTFSSTPGNFV
jgi:hypothetical protein